MKLNNNNNKNETRTKRTKRSRRSSEIVTFFVSARSFIFAGQYIVAIAHNYEMKYILLVACSQLRENV